MNYDQRAKFEGFLVSLNKLPVSKNRIFYPIDEIRKSNWFQKSTHCKLLYEMHQLNLPYIPVGKSDYMTAHVERVLLSIPLKELCCNRVYPNNVTLIGETDALTKLLIFMEGSLILIGCKHFPEFEGLTYSQLPSHLRAKIQKTPVYFKEFEKNSTSVWAEMLNWKAHHLSLFPLREFIWNIGAPKFNETHTPLKCFELIRHDVFIEDSKLEVWKDENKCVALVFIILELYYAPETPFISVDLLIDAVYKDMCHNWSGEYFEAVRSHLNALPSWPDINKATSPDNINYSREFGNYINSRLSDLDKYAVGFESFIRRLFNHYERS